jgi:hypothetical protein
VPKVRIYGEESGVGSSVWHFCLEQRTIAGKMLKLVVCSVKLSSETYLVIVGSLDARSRDLLECCVKLKD